MSNEKIVVLIGGLIILGALIFNWSNDLSEIKIGTQFREHGITAGGSSPEQAAMLKSQINTKYGLFSGLTVAGVGILYFIFSRDEQPKQSKRTEIRLKPLTNTPSMKEKKRANVKLDPLTNTPIIKEKENRHKQEIDALRARLEELERKT